jgi:hypothetical protein
VRAKRVAGRPAALAPCLEWLAEWAGMVGFDDLAHALETAAKPDDIEAAVRDLLECLATLAGDERKARRLLLEIPRDERSRRVLAALAPPRRGRPRKPKSPKPEGSRKRGRPRGSSSNPQLDSFLATMRRLGVSPASLARFVLRVFRLRNEETGEWSRRYAQAPHSYAAVLRRITRLDEAVRFAGVAPALPTISPR